MKIFKWARRAIVTAGALSLGYVAWDHHTTKLYQGTEGATVQFSHRLQPEGWAIGSSRVYMTLRVPCRTRGCIGTTVYGPYGIGSLDPITRELKPIPCTLPLAGRCNICHNGGIFNSPRLGEMCRDVVGLYQGREETGVPVRSRAI